MIRKLFALCLLVASGFSMTAVPLLAGGRDTDGVVAVVARDAIVVLDNQRKEVVFAVNPGTRILRNGKPAVMSQIAIGDDVRVNAMTRNSRWTARMISAVGLD